jgi:hypothetical protein
LKDFTAATDGDRVIPRLDRGVTENEVTENGTTAIALTSPA